MKTRFRYLCYFMILATASAFGEDPQKTTLCEVKNDPQAFNHKLIEVTVFVSHGFEEFSALDPECEYTPTIWIEYGGTRASDTMYCCGVTPGHTRASPLKVEGIPIALVDDEMFRKFDAVIRTKQDTVIHTTVVGRFFAGKRENGSNWGGYGHEGCCSLLVLEQIRNVEPQDRDDLDYGSSPDQPNMEEWKCGSFTDLLFTFHRFRPLLKAQQDAELGKQEWVFEDASRVAKQSLAQILKVDPVSIKGLKLVLNAQGRRVFTWKPKSRGGFMIVMSKPYWLSFYANDSRRVAWVATAAYKVCD